LRTSSGSAARQPQHRPTAELQVAAWRSSHQRPPLQPGSGAAFSPPRPLPPPASSATVRRPPALASRPWIRQRVEDKREARRGRRHGGLLLPAARRVRGWGKQIAGATGLAGEGRARRTRDPSAGADDAYSARARVASVWENGTNPSTREMTGTPSVGVGGEVSAKCASYRRGIKTCCTCPKHVKMRACSRCPKSPGQRIPAASPPSFSSSPLLCSPSPGALSDSRMCGASAQGHGFL
jgi:hypothetical protein